MTVSRVAPALALVLILGPDEGMATSAPIRIDGYFDEWPAGTLVVTDPTGDHGPSGIDFTELRMANDENWLYIRFDTTTEVQGDEGHDITLYLDTDLDETTGLPVGGLGAELAWNVGERAGTFYGPGGAVAIDHPEIGIVLGPTVSDTQFEIAIARDAMPDGEPLFPLSSFDLLLFDVEGNGDFVFHAHPGYTFDPTPQPVSTIPFDRDHPDHVRIAGYNIENDGLFSGGAREQALQRIFTAVDPDVWVISEVWGHAAEEVRDRVEEFLPSASGESWSAVKRDAGNVVVSRLPILDSWEIFPGNRLTGVLLDLRPAHDSDLLVVANHWSCCTNDASRQEQADALIAFLRDARTPGGEIDLAPDTPIVAAGDFNLVGWRRQLETLITGDILDNGTWGPDAAPDWDGSDFDDANPRHPDARFAYTWRNDWGSFYPGKLDWWLYTGSVATLEKTFVVETRTMTAQTLAQYGLQADDTELGSDHAPVVGDMVPSTTVGVADPGDDDGASVVGPTMLPARPNPFTSSTTITFEVARAGVVTVEIYDAAGRQVRSLMPTRRLDRGRHSVVWDGLDDSGTPVGAGVYVYRVRTREISRGRRVIILR